MQFLLGGGNVGVFQYNNAKAERKIATFSCEEKCKEIIR